MRSIFVLSLIGYVVSVTFALNEENNIVYKRDVDQLLKPVTGGGIGSISPGNGVTGILTENIVNSDSPRQKRSSMNKRQLPVGINGLLGGAILGSLTGTSKPAESPKDVPQNRAHHQGHRQKRSSMNKRQLPVGIDGLLGGAILGSLTGTSKPAESPKDVPQNRAHHQGHRQKRSIKNKRDPSIGVLDGILGSRKAHPQQANPSDQSRAHPGKSQSSGGDGLLGGTSLLGGAGGLGI